MRLLDIIIQGVELAAKEAEKESWWSDFGKNALANTVGGIVGVGGSLWLYYRSIRNDKAKEQAIRVENQESKLKYLAALLASAISTGKDQNKNIKDYIAKIEEDNVTFHEIVFVPIYDLKRIVETDKLEEFLLAFTEKFREDTNAAQKLRRILSAVDFLYEQFKQLPEWLGNAQKFDYQRKEKYKQLFDEAQRILEPMIKYYGENNFPLVKEMIEIRTEFQETSTSNLDLKHRYTYYFQPYAKLADEFYSYNSTVSGPYFNFAALLREGISTFDHTIYEHERLRKELMEVYKNVKESLEELELQASDLLRLINPNQQESHMGSEPSQQPN